ncbi:relaxase/mobilization nuclease domain-containing protein [Octadecabacter sp. G9-8]|uniref:Relaxase/mobilization nuclease domain-containing protein n=1 Tax=Octadecabacter dasysiphoniae TaxID=2909341 RepID=A0ABS9CRP5_9RHOB|nr:relaxase/mobilization nuclease domain-containing protein [Octadecabacter dasysiphoniae]MCF2869905.1 relaxase/mobilization nuclease domain-containing protein [Octadecabacter dasysiphoniae]
MIISFFSSGTGGGAAPVDYLTAPEVLAYDENRNLIRDEYGQPQTKIRDPLPEVLHGNPDRTRDLIDASANKWSYTAGVVSFADSDQPSEDAQQEAIELFEALAFAGLEADQYDCLWVRHVHEGNVELHFCTPRLELATGRALNIAPPGHEAAFSTLRDVLNKTHGWADPMEPDLARDFKLVRESADRAEARQVIVSALYDQIDAGLITDRASMVAFFEDTGFEVTRQAAKSISVRDPEFTKPFKLEGVLTHENWSTTRHAEIAAEHETDADANRTRRLDGISHDSLRSDLADHVERRAKYNEERYGALSVSQQELVRGTNRTDQELDDVLTLDHHGDNRDGDRLDDGRELALDGTTDALGTDRTGPDADRQGGRDMAGAGPDQDATKELYAGRQISDLHQARGELNDGNPDSLGTRLARLRRAVGDGLRGLSKGIERIRGTLDERDAEPDGWYRTMRDAAGAFAGRINASIAWIVERGSELRDAGRTIEQELELSEGRRREAETELEAREVEMDRRLTH